MIRELVPSSHQRSELRNTILCIFSGWDQRIGEGIPIPDSLGEETTFINICIGNRSLKCHRVLISTTPSFGDKVICWYTGFTFKKLLKGLNPSKALGPDELHPRVLKELATELGPVFAHLFQQSIDIGEIPKEWSLANICPLFKKSDRSLACNYRPVSLTCVHCKLLEHIVCSNIMAHLDEHKLLSDRQHAFRKGHSCETQLTTVINDWAKILDNRGQVDTFILDFEKAFDNPLMNSLKANCLAMESVTRHWNG